MGRIRLLALVLLALVALGSAWELRIEDDASALLPRDEALRSTLAAAERFAGGRTLLVAVVPPTDTDADVLTEEVSRLAAALRTLPYVEDVRAGVDNDELEAIRDRIRPYRTAFIRAEALRELVSVDGIRAALTRQAVKLEGWGAFFFRRSVEEDPLDLHGRALASLGSPTRGTTLERGLLRTRSGAVLLLVRTHLDPGRVQPSDPQIRALEEVLARSTFPVRWFGGIRLAAGTADTIHADVTRTSTVGALLLTVVLLLGLRSWRPVVGALPPLAVASATTLLGAWWCSPIHPIQLGFSVALAGLAVDYWIHLYLAAEAHPEPDAGERAWRALRPGLVVSAGSTALGFLALTASSIPVVEILGWTGATAALGALLGAALLGPPTFALVRPPASRAASWHPPRGAGPVLLTALVLGLVGGTHSRFDADPMALLAKPAAVADDEAWFRTEGLLPEAQALVRFTGPDAHHQAAEAALALSDLQLGPVIGPGSSLPSPQQVERRRDALPPVDVLQARIDREAAALGLGPFPGAAARIHGWAQPPPTTLWEGTLNADRVLLGPDEALLLLPIDDPAVLPALRDTLEAHTARPLIVPATITAERMEATRSDLLHYGAIGAVGVFLLLAFRHRSATTALLALAPAASALAGSAGVMVLAGLPWNPVSLATLVPVLGLAVDYGALLVEGHPTAPRAIGLSAMTTLAGFLPLALAQSPALAGAGLAVGAGVGTAGAVAVVVLPALHGGWPAAWIRPWIERLALAVVLGLHLDVGWIILASFVPPLPRRTLPTAVEQVGAERRSGPVRLVRTQGIHVLYTEGEPYEVGWHSRRVTSHLRPRLEEELFDSFVRNVPYAPLRWLITRGSLAVGWTLEQHLLPAHRAEIQGGDDADERRRWFSGPGYTRKIYYHALHDIGQALVDSPLLACTGFLAGGSATVDGHWLLARNFDFEGGVAFDRDKVVRVHRSRTGLSFASVGFAGLIGAVSGVNEAGIAVAMNAAGSAAPPRPGTPMTLILREILESASTLEQAEAILRRRTGFVSENVLVVDADHHRAALFEITPEQVVRIDVDGSLGVANHFRSPALRDDPVNRHRIATTTTAARQARMDELLTRFAGSLDLARATAILTDRRGVGDAPLARGHRHALDALIATHGVAIDATTRTLRVSRFPNLSAGFVELRLDELLEGRLEARPVGPSAGDARAALAMRRGRELLRQARRASHTAALALTEEALRAMGDHPEAHFERGRVLLEAGRTEEARHHLRRARELRPEYVHQAEAIDAWLR